MNRKVLLNLIRQELRAIPECMTVSKIERLTRLGKNHIYDLINSSILPSFIYQGINTVYKDDLIKLMLDCWNEPLKLFRLKSLSSVSLDEPYVNGISENLSKVSNYANYLQSLDERRKRICYLLRNCPLCISPKQASKWILHGRNHIYKLIETGELQAFTFQGCHMIYKSDLIDYICRSWDEPNKTFTTSVYADNDTKPDTDRLYKHTDTALYLEEVLKDCPDCMSFGDIKRWTNFGKNKIYLMLRDGVLRTSKVGGTAVVAKADFIQYLIEHSEDKTRRSVQIEALTLSRSKRGASDE